MLLRIYNPKHNNLHYPGSVGRCTFRDAIFTIATSLPGNYINKTIAFRMLLQPSLLI